MHKGSIRAIFVAVLVMVPVQAMWRTVAPEPWPALYQPAFRHVPVVAGETPVFVATVIAVGDDGRTQELTGEQLFDGYRVTVPQAMRVLFRDGLDEQGSLRNQRSSSLVRYLARGPELGQYGRAGASRAEHPATADFLRERMAVLVPFGVRTVRVEWSEQTLDATATVVASTRTHVVTVEL